MATIALIQDQFRVLNYESSDRLHGLQKQIHEDFFESLESAYNHTLFTARTLNEYQQKGYGTPDVVICAPLPEEGNPAPGLEAIQSIRAAFPEVPVIVWSNRPGDSLRDTCLKDLGCTAYYTGTLITAPEELPVLIDQVLA